MFQRIYNEKNHMTYGTKNNSLRLFYLFSDYDIIPPMTPHPDDVTILFEIMMSSFLMIVQI